MTIAQFLDFAAVFVFALTGALVASRAQLDVIGFLFVASLTAVGGGTIRDLILGRDPVFWVGNPAYIGLACIAAILVFFTAHLLESRYRAILWLDAIALAVAVSAGIAVAMGTGAGWPIILIMGVTTGCLGGLMRDVVCNEVPLVLKQGEIYVTAALMGAFAGLVSAELLGPPAAPLVCTAVTFALRAGGLAFGWSLPVYKSRPPKNK